MSQADGDSASLRFVTSLFTELGYPVRITPIDPAEWRRAGIAVDPECRLLHAARVGSLDLLLLCSASPARGASMALLEGIHHLNRLRKQVVVNIAERDDIISIYDIDDRRRPRRIDLSRSRPQRHALERLNLLELSGSPTRLELKAMFDRAMSRDLLARHFFGRFRDGVTRLTNALREAAPVESPDACAAQALLVLSRLLFLYFVQQKGWLDLRRSFLHEHFTTAQREGRSFYLQVLIPLFFGCLNTPLESREEDAKKLGRIPYLNGGLFQRSPFELRNVGLPLPNELFGQIVESVFERFSFSLDEGDEEGAQVDPEMLGKVFESLMAGEERLRTGTFYTPKAVVEVLAERAIVEYCSDGTGPGRRVLRHVLRGRDVEIDEQLRDALLARARAIAVLDPACGSGAFLLSALRLLERIQSVLAPGELSVSALRQQIVEKSLYGVDLKPEAVRLCELRLWLAIVAASDAEIERIPPLPNLDRNILQGNSLLSPLDHFAAGRNDVYCRWSYALAARAKLTEEYRTARPGQKPLLARYLRESDLRLAAALVSHSIESDEAELEILRGSPPLFGAEAIQTKPTRAEAFLRRRIAQSREMLRRLEEGELDFFSFDIHFSQVTSRGGFGVVVGNPPWVRNSRVDAELKRKLMDRYTYFRKSPSSAFSQPDLAIAFVEKALGLTAPDGVVSMLLPSKVATAGYASSLRSEVAATSRIVAIDDWSSDSKRLFDADTFPMGLTLARAADASRKVVISTGGRNFRCSQGRFLGADPGAGWSLAPPDVEEIIRSLEDRFEPLATALGRMPLMGVKSGANGSFFVGEVEIRHRDALLVELGERVPHEALVRVIRGRDVRRWRAEPSTWMLWPPKNGPSRWAERVAGALGMDRADFRLSYARPQHFGIKVVWKDVSRGLQAAAVGARQKFESIDFQAVPNQTVYFLSATCMEEAQVISAVLNSSTFEALATSRAERAKDFHYRYFASLIGRIAWPDLRRGSETWCALGRLAVEMRRNGGAGGEIDSIVGSAYGLDRRQVDRLLIHRRRLLNR